jgi:hypothetical protein
MYIYISIIYYKCPYMAGKSCISLDRTDRRLLCTQVRRTYQPYNIYISYIYYTYTYYMYIYIQEPPVDPYQPITGQGAVTPVQEQ